MLFFSQKFEPLRLDRLRKINMLLDLHLSDKTFPGSGQLQIGIQNQGGFLANTYTGFNPGITVVLRALPLFRSVSADFDELSIEERKCRFRDQVDI